MDKYKKLAENADQTLYCNCCGKPISRSEVTGEYADYLHIEKAWGYFSSKDLTGHAFNICEECYDKWLKNFAIPVEEFPVDEIHMYSDEEIEILNKAYAAEKCR